MLLSIFLQASSSNNGSSFPILILVASVFLLIGFGYIQNKKGENSNSELQFPLGVKLLIGTLAGWAIALGLVCLLIPELPKGEEWRLWLLLTLAPGAISGIIVTYVINTKKNSKNKEQDKTVVVGTQSVQEQLWGLKQLLDSGVISQEEFDNQKAKILSK